MPLFTLNFRKRLIKPSPEPVILPKVEKLPEYVSETKKEDVKSVSKNKIKVKNNSTVKLKNLSKKLKEIHISEDEDTE